MNIFEELTQAIEDHDILWTALKEADRAAQAVTSAVTERIRTDKETNDERVATLTAQSKDPARPSVVQRLAQQELDRLQGCTFGPAEAEKAAFDSAMQDARDALRDFSGIKARLRELFAAVNAELQAMRAATLGSTSKDADLAQRHLDGEQRAFDRLYQS